MRRSLVTTPVVVAALAMVVHASPVDLMIGARGYGMGGGYVAVVDDPSAAYWNPGALGRVEELSLMESNWILQDVEGLNINYASLAVPVPHVGTVSGSWLASFASLEEMGSDGKLESNHAGEHTFSLSVGRALWDELLVFQNTSVGFTINRYSFLTSEGNGSGLGFDLGVQTGFPYGLSVGFAARTLATDVMGDKVDPELRLGVGYQQTFVEMHKVTVDIDGAYKRHRDYQNAGTLEPAANNMKMFGGVEYALLIEGWEIALRGGGNAMVLHNTRQTYGYAAGLGVKYLGYSVQYAFKGDTDPEATLGYGHRVDLILQLMKLGL